MIIMVALNPFFNKKTYKYYLWLILFVLVYFAYYIKITPTMDLYRRVEEMMLYQETSFEWFLENRMNTDPLGNLFFYFFSLFEDYRILPAFTIFTCYSAAFYILLKCADRYDLTKTQMNWLLWIFIMCFYYDQALSNIRIYVGYAIISVFMYNDIVEGRYRKTAVIVYILSCFFHYALAIVLIPRILLYIKNNIKISEVVIYAFLAVCALFGDVLLSQLSGLGGFFQTAADKTVSYAGYAVFGKWQFLSSILRVGMFIALAEFVKKTAQDLGQSERDACFYLNCVNLILVVMYNNYQLMLRTPNYVHYLGMVILAVFLKMNGKMKDNDVMYMHLIFQFLLIVIAAYTLGYQAMFIHPSVDFLR